MTFGGRLRQIRRENDLTQKELGAKIGVSEGAMSLYEKDKRQPSFEVLSAIARVCHTDMNYLLGSSSHFAGTGKGPDVEAFARKVLQEVQKTADAPQDFLEELFPDDPDMVKKVRKVTLGGTFEDAEYLYKMTPEAKAFIRSAIVNAIEISKEKKVSTVVYKRKTE